MGHVKYPQDTCLPSHESPLLALTFDHVEILLFVLAHLCNTSFGGEIDSQF